LLKLSGPLDDERNFFLAESAIAAGRICHARM
jgi:hypothetical protein